MVRKTKSEAPVATPTVTVTVESAPAVEKKPKAEKKPKTAAATATTPVVEVAPTPAPVVETAPATETTVDVSTLASKLNDFGSKIQQVTTILSSMKADYKLLEKSVSRELKAASKSKKSKKASTGNRQPSGFVKPSVISDELIAFYEGKTAKWQIPDDVVFVDAIPLGGTGKMLKTKLRETLKDYKLPA